MKFTVHMIVQNEEYWIESAINSVLSKAEKIIVYDTGSKDATVQVIKKFGPKLIFEEKGTVDHEQMVELRNEQIRKTETDWFMILDGDEVYPRQIFDKLPNEGKYWGIFLKNHLCTGDVYHSLPEKYGKYEFCGRYGHLNLRFYRKIKAWKWYGTYPLEYYGDEKGNSINLMCDKLFFLNDYYWHLSFLKRSRIRDKNHIKYHLGERIIGGLPEVFDDQALKKRSNGFVARSLIETPIRFIKNLVF